MWSVFAELHRYRVLICFYRVLTEEAELMETEMSSCPLQPTKMQIFSLFNLQFNSLNTVFPKIIEIENARFILT